MKGGTTMEEIKEIKLNKAEQNAKDIEDANKAAERLEAANRKQEELIGRQEALNANDAYGGQSEAGGQPIKEEPVSAKDYAKAVMAGEVDPFSNENVK